jgi:tetratricopeptide (TPR) repeat protein
MTPMSDGNATPSTDAQSIFEEGLGHYRRGDAVEAHACFERAHRRAPADPRIMSWYGLTLVLVEKNSSLGIVLCDQALRTSGPEPELLLNQARAHLALGQRDYAVKTIARGLAAWPLDPSLKVAQACMGWRRRAVIPFLSRSNPLNRWLGKLRHRFSQRLHPAPDFSPMTLGLLPEDSGPEK